MGNIAYDPYPGWANNLIGPIGLFVAAGKGILRVCYMRKENTCRMFPADVTVNGILIKAWDYIENKYDQLIDLLLFD